MKTFKYLVTFGRSNCDRFTLHPFWVEVNRPIEEADDLRQLTEQVVIPATATSGFLGNPQGMAREWVLSSVSLLRAGDTPENETAPFRVLKFSEIGGRVRS